MQEAKSETAELAAMVQSGLKVFENPRATVQERSLSMQWMRDHFDVLSLDQKQTLKDFVDKEFEENSDKIISQLKGEELRQASLYNDVVLEIKEKLNREFEQKEAQAAK